MQCQRELTDARDTASRLTRQLLREEQRSGALESDLRTLSGIRGLVAKSLSSEHLFTEDLAYAKEGGITPAGTSAPGPREYGTRAAWIR